MKMQIVDALNQPINAALQLTVGNVMISASSIMAKDEEKTRFDFALFDAETNEPIETGAIDTLEEALAEANKINRVRKVTDVRDNMSEAVTDAADDAKEKIGEVAGDAKEKIGEAADKAQEKIGIAGKKIGSWFKRGEK